MGSGETLRHSVENAQGRERVGWYVLGFQEIDQTQVAVASGKGAHLGELSRTLGPGRRRSEGTLRFRPRPSR